MHIIVHIITLIVYISPFLKTIINTYRQMPIIIVSNSHTKRIRQSQCCIQLIANRCTSLRGYRYIVIQIMLRRINRTDCHRMFFAKVLRILCAKIQLIIRNRHSILSHK